MKLSLPNVTLIGVDCIDLKRLQLAAEISCKDIDFGGVKLLTSIESNDPRVVKIPNIDSIKKYSNFMIKELYKYVDTEFILVFQYDGFVLNAKAWSDSFLEYDYIGSPWYHIGDLRVGNGGFSLRSKKLLTWLGNNWRRVGSNVHPEDVYISRFARPYLEENGMKFATEEVASKFGMEGNERTVIWNGEFGFHGLKYTDISNWLSVNTEYKEVINNKLGEYETLMKKYPVYDGTVHTFRFKKQNIDSYILLDKNKKKYEARLLKEKNYDFSYVKIGDTVICKKSGISSGHQWIPSFERKVIKIEKFNTFKELRVAHPKMHVSYPIKDIHKWQVPFMKVLGDFVYPKNFPYIVFWFD